jgi:hypothetical protein
VSQNFNRQKWSKYNLGKSYDECDRGLVRNAGKAPTFKYGGIKMLSTLLETPDFRHGVF